MGEYTLLEAGANAPLGDVDLRASEITLEELGAVYKSQDLVLQPRSSSRRLVEKAWTTAQMIHEGTVFFAVPRRPDLQLGRQCCRLC